MAKEDSANHRVYLNRSFMIPQAIPEPFVRDLEEAKSREWTKKQPITFYTKGIVSNVNKSISSGHTPDVRIRSQIAISEDSPVQFPRQMTSWLSFLQRFAILWDLPRFGENFRAPQSWTSSPPPFFQTKMTNRIAMINELEWVSAFSLGLSAKHHYENIR